MEPDIKIDLPISKSLVNKVVEPSLVPLSKAIGGIFHWVFQKPIEYGVIKTAELENLKTKTEQQLNMIPEENRTSEFLGLTLKAFEDSRYQLSNEQLVDYFAKLIAGTVDNKCDVKPIYSTILSEMTSDDANLLGYFFNKKYLFVNQISHSNPSFKDERYRYFSKKKYFVISGEYEEGMYREPENFAEYFSKDIDCLDIEQSFLFLLSKGLISHDQTHNSHVLIHAVEKKSIETDEWYKQMIDKFSNYIYNRVTLQETEVYTLTPLGSALADLVCHED